MQDRLHKGKWLSKTVTVNDKVFLCYFHAAEQYCEKETLCWVETALEIS